MSEINKLILIMGAIALFLGYAACGGLKTEPKVITTVGEVQSVSHTYSAWSGDHTTIELDSLVFTTYGKHQLKKGVEYFMVKRHATMICPETVMNDREKLYLTHCIQIP